MPQNIELPDELAAALSDEASRLGLSLPEYAVRVLATGRSPENSIRNGSELVAFWRSEGLIGSRPEISDSQTEARRLRDEAQRRGGAELCALQRET